MFNLFNLNVIIHLKPKSSDVRLTGQRNLLRVSAWLLLVLFLVFNQQTLLADVSNDGNCEISVEVDLTDAPDAVWQPVNPVSLGEACCGMPPSQNCFELVIYLHQDAKAVNIELPVSGQFYYIINCSGGSNTLAEDGNLKICVESPGETISVTFCPTGIGPFTPVVTSLVSGVDIDFPAFDPLCLNGSPVLLNTAVPSGGNYFINGETDSDSSFDPAVWGEGEHEVIYVYDDPESVCQGVENQIVTVYSPPELSCDDLSFGICQGSDPVNLHDFLTQLPQGGIFRINGTSVTNFDPVTAGVFNIVYSYTDPSTGCSSECSFQISVNPKPVVEDQAVSLCAFDQNAGEYDLTTLENDINNEPENTISWFEDGALSVSVGNPAGVSVVDGDIFYAVVENGFGCSSVATVSFDLDNLDVQDFSAVFCDESENDAQEIYNTDLDDYIDQMIAIGAGSASVQWFTDASLQDFIPGSVVDTITDNDVFYLFVENGVCQQSAQLDFTVHSLPELSCSGFSLCVNEDILDLSTRVSVAGGVFSGDGVNGEQFDPGVAGVGTHTISYQITDPVTECVNTCSFVIEVKPLPVLDCPADIQVCIDTNPFLLEDALPEGGSYSGNGVSEDGDGFLFDPAAANIGTHTITYTYQENGCVNSCTFTVLVVNQPEINCAGDMEVCETSAPVILSDLDVAPQGGTFSGNHVVENNGEYTFDPSSSGAGTFEVTYQIGIEGEGCFNSCSFQIVVNPLPVVDCGNATYETCRDEPSFNLSDAFPGISPQGGTFYLNNNPVTSFNPNTSGSFSLSYTYQDTSTQCLNSCEVTVVVNPLPAYNNIQESLCDPFGDGFVVMDLTSYEDQINADAGVSFEYYVNTSLTVPVDNPQNEQVTDGERFYVKVTDNTTGCFSKALMIFNVSNLDIPENFVIDLCDESGTGDLWVPNQSLNDFNVDVFPFGGAVNYQWFEDPELSIPVVGSVTVSDNSVFYLQITVEDCVAVSEVLFRVNPLTELDCSLLTDIQVCLNDDPFDLFDYYDQIDTSGRFFITNTPVTIFDPQNGTGVYNMRYVYENEFGCKSECEFTIQVQQPPVANDFTVSLCNSTGSQSVNLTSYFDQITNNINNTVSFFLDQTLNTTVPDPTGHVVSDGDIVYVLVENQFCSNTSVIEFEVSTELIVEDAQVALCDESTDDSQQVFNVDLAQFNNDIYPESEWVNFEWYLNPELNNPVNGVVPVVNHMDQFYVNVSQGSCLADATLTIEVEELPQLSCESAQNTEICINAGPVDFNTTDFVSLTGGTFSGNGVEDNLFYPDSVGFGNHTIDYTYTTDGLCEVTCSFDVQVKDYEPVTCVSDTVFYCIESGVHELIQGQPEGGTYYGTGVYFNNDFNAWYFDPLDAGLGSFEILYVRESNGCVDTCSFIVTVRDLPQVTCSGDFNICDTGELYNLSELPADPEGGVYMGPHVVLENGIYYFDTGDAAPGDFLLKYEYTDPQTGGVDCCEFTITIDPLPEITFSDLEICANETAYDLNQIVEPVGGTFAGTGVTDDAFNASVPGAGTHQITYTWDNGKCSDTVKINVEVLQPEDLSCPADPIILCEGSGLYLLDDVLPAGGDYSGTGIVMQGGSYYFDPSQAGIDTHIISYTYVSGVCTSVCEFEIQVEPLADLACSEDITICRDHGAIILNQTTHNPQGGEFSGPGVTVEGDNYVFNPFAANIGSNTITYIFTDEVTGCQNQCQFIIEVLPLPQIGNCGVVEVCQDDQPVVLTDVFDQLTPGGTFSYQGEGITEFSVATPGDYIFTYHLTGQNNCDTSCEVTLIVNPIPAVQDVNLSVCDPSGQTVVDLVSYQNMISTQDNVSFSFFFADQTSITDPGNVNITDGQNIIAQVQDNNTGCIANAEMSFSVGDIQVFNPVVELCDESGGAAMVYDVDLNQFNEQLFSGSNNTNYTWYTETELINEITGNINIISHNDIYYLNIVEDACQETVEVVFNVNLLPDLVCEDFDVCSSNSAFDLTQTVNLQGGVFNGVFVDDETFNAEDAGAGEYTITYSYTDENECMVSCELTANVLNATEVTCIEDFSICLNAPVYPLTDAAPDGGYFTGSGISEENGQFFFNPKVAGPGNHVITYTYFDGTCENSCHFSIEVLGLPLIECHGDIQVCEGEPAFQLDLLPDGGTLTGEGFFIENGNYFFDPGAVAPGNYLFEYVYQDEITSCTNVCNFIVVVNPLPLLSLEGDAEFCSNAGMSKLDFVEPMGGNYSGDFVLPGNGFDLANSGAGTFEIEYYYEDNNQCASTLDFDLTVHQSPVATVTSISETGQCGVVQPEAAVSGGTQPYNWLWEPPGLFQNPESLNPTSFPLSSDANFSFRVTDDNGCTDTASVEISVDNSFEVSLQPFNPVCENDPYIALTGGQPAGGEYFINEQTEPSRFFIPSDYGSGSHTITYVYETSEGCFSFDRQVILVHPKPSIKWNGQSFCAGDEFMPLEDALPEGGYFSGEFVWNNTFDVQNSGLGDFWVQYHYTDSLGCYNSLSSMVSVNPLPMADAGDDILIQSNNYTTLEAAPAGEGDYLYKWSPAIFLVSPLQQQTFTSDLLNTQVFDLEVTNLDNQCQNTDEVVVFVEGGITFDFSSVTANPETICEGDSAVISALVYGGSSEYSYFWYEQNPMDFPDQEPLNADTLSYMFTVFPHQTTKYHILVVDEKGWEINSEVTVTVNEVPQVSISEPEVLCKDEHLIFENLKPSHDEGQFYILRSESRQYLAGPFLQSDTLFAGSLSPGSYIVLYMLENASGCVASAEHILNIPDIFAGFSISVPDICNPNRIRITNQSYGGNEYIWDFGDGAPPQTINDEQFFYEFPLSENAQDYTITLNVVHDDCQQSHSKDITVNPIPVAQFEPIEDGCAPLQANLVNTSFGDNISGYYWELGDGTSSTEENPIKIFENQLASNVVYDVTLYLYYQDYFCETSVSHPVIVYPEVIPGFTVQPISGCSPLEVNVVNQASNAEWYRWDMGEGVSLSYSSEEQPDVFSQSFFNLTAYPDTINITQQTWLERNEQKVCEQIISDQLIVYPEITATISDDSGQLFPDTVSFCAPEEVSVSSMGSVNAQTFTWRLDGSVVSSETSFAIPLNNTSGETIRRQLILETGSEFGCSDTDTLIIEVFPQLTAQFDIASLSGCLPLSLEAVNTSHITEGTEFSWFINDQLVSVETDLNFEYDDVISEPEVLEIHLVAESEEGCLAEWDDTFTAYPQVSASVTANGQFEMPSVCAPEMVTLSAADSQNANNYNWIVSGQSLNSGNMEVDHLFTNPGIHHVVLEASSQWGCSDTDTLIAEVFDTPQAQFVLSENMGCSPLETQFIYPNLPNANDLWYFDAEGDGNPVELQPGSVPDSYVYVNNTSEPIIYEPTITIENQNGCTADYSAEVLVYPKVNAQITLTEYPDSTSFTGCNPVELSLNSSDSENATQFSWMPGDGTTIEEENIDFSYNNFNINEIVDKEIILISGSEFGCSDSDTLNVSILPQPVPGFLIMDGNGCSPLDVSFFNTSVGAESYLWDFGDGNQSTELSAQHTFMNSGTEQHSYIVSLTAQNAFGCSAAMEQEVVVHPAVSADFQVSALQGCSPLTVEFTNLSAGNGLNYTWDYGDGTVSNTAETSHSHTFINPDPLADQVFNVSLTVDNDNGCSSTMIYQLLVKATPVADFSLSETEGCEPLQIEINNTSTQGMNYQWHFNDQNVVQPSEVFTHTFFTDETGENQQVELVVTSGNGCTAVHSEEVLVFNQPEVAFEMSVVEGCDPLEVSFSNQTTGATEYEWNFGNAVTSGEVNPQHLFTSQNSDSETMHLVHLMANNNNGCINTITDTVIVFPGPESVMELSSVSGCAPFSPVISSQSQGAQMLRWDFGDGNNSQDAQPTYTWENSSDQPDQYTLQLFVVNDFGCEDVSSELITVFPGIEAAFTTQDGMLKGCSPYDINFINETIHTGNSFFWDFDNGNTTETQNPFHTFFNNTDTTLTFDVEMSTVSPFGCSDTTIQTVTVYPKPLADFVVTPLQQSFPSTTIHINNKTNPDVWNYSWDFGDGNTSQTEEASFDHTYAWDGEDFSVLEYQVSMTIYNGICNNTQSKEVRITPPVPDARFVTSHGASGEVIQGCAPLRVDFSNQSVFADAYFWDFDDGNISQEKDPIYVFSDPGMYDVMLIAIGQGGNDTIYTTFEVLPYPVADFEIVEKVLELPLEPLKLINLSQNADGYYWDFGDGNFSDQFEPVHYYQEIGLYDIKLQVFTNSEPQCTDTMVVRQTVRTEKACRMIFPTGFKPVKSGPSGGHYNPAEKSNTVFYPVNTGLDEFELEIYNRWGEKVFYSDDINVGWDGYINGRAAPMGVYVWRAKAKCVSGREIEKAGDVTLVR